jgi:hypothetical protein
MHTHPHSFVFEQLLNVTHNRRECTAVPSVANRLTLQHEAMTSRCHGSKQDCRLHKTAVFGHLGSADGELTACAHSYGTQN